MIKKTFIIRKRDNQQVIREEDITVIKKQEYHAVKNIAIMKKKLIIFSEIKFSYLITFNSMKKLT